MRRSRRRGPQVAHAWEMFFPLSCAVVHFGTVPGVIAKSLSSSSVTVFANPPWALLPGWA